MIRTCFSLITVFLLALLFASCSGSTEKSTPAAQNTINPEFLSNIHTTKAVVSNREKTLTLAGKVEYDPNKVIHYSPLMNGVIVRSSFSLGDHVQSGQAMLDVRSAELSALQSERIAMETEEMIAQRELKTAHSMYADGMLSERELFEAQGRLKQIQAALNKVQSDMSVYGEDKGNGVFSIKAPMTGYVVAKNASSGSTLSEGSDPLFTIADLSTVWIIANVYAGSLQLVSEDMEVEITSVAYPQEVFKGKINFISQVFDAENKALKARIVLPNTELKLKPEMSVMVKLLNESNDKMVTIPSDAVIFDNNSYFVVVGSKDFAIRKIVPSDHHNDVTYVSEGLEPGEEIVTKNQLLIYNQLK